MKYILIILVVAVMSFILGLGKIITRFKRSIKINLDKYQFSPGEEITGTLILKLKKAIQAKGLSVRLLGKEVINSREGGVSNSRTNVIFDFSLPLDGEKEYPAGKELSYSFNIKIPVNVFGEQPLVEIDTRRLFGASIGSRRIDWFVIGRLESPGFDIIGKTKINIA